MRKKKIIQVPPKNIGLLADTMRVSKVAVWNALAFRSDSENAQLIRKKALSDYGGIETVKTIM